MGEQRTRDEIDLELSRTYFGNAADKKPPIPQESAQQEKQPNVPRPARRTSSTLKILFALWIISIIVFAASYFLRENRIVFSLNISVEPHPASVKKASSARAKRTSSPKTIQASLPKTPKDLSARTKQAFLSKKIQFLLPEKIQDLSPKTIQASLPKTPQDLLARTKQVSSPEIIQASLPKTPQDLLARIKQLPSPKTIRASLPEATQASLPATKPVSSPETSRIVPLRKAPEFFNPATSKGEILYDFNFDEEGWEIPSWELEKPDHVARSLAKTNRIASEGRGSLKLDVEFPGGRWTAALAEVQQYLNFKNYDTIQADIYVPASCPKGLRGKLILTVGEDWKFVEMARNVRLIPGKWTTIKASIAEESTDWRRMVVDKFFKTDVRKIAIRIESNRKPAYSGPIYIDNIRISTDKNN